KLKNALTGLGFFYIQDNNFSPKLVQDIRKSANDIFNLPLPDKKKIKMNKNFRGWGALDEEITLNIPDHKETLDFGYDEPLDPDAKGYKVMRGPNQWPDNGDKDLKPRVENYMKEMTRIGQILLQAIARIMGKDGNSLLKYFQNPFSLLRFIHYPPTSGIKSGVGRHTDYGFLTMISQDDSVSGLQALSKTGEWVNVDPIPNTFAVNIGDTLEAWSGGILRATPHRVINISSDSSRLSIPFFFDPDLDSIV
ncbi:hypothetical protein BC833DRAFT_511961, partial [Globomyces pollinis-pini]